MSDTPDPQAAISLNPDSLTLRTLEENRAGIVLTGRLKNGVVELDKSCLEHIARKHPNANISFVAVNAPLDPEPLATGGNSK